MRDGLLKFFGPREEKIQLGGETVCVRTLPDDADREPFKEGEPGDYLWKFAVACSFYENGQPAFTNDDIPLLKAAPKILVLPLIRAVENVNGFNAYLEIKNSDAAPSSG